MDFAVVMAMHGKPDPDLANVKVGASRAEVELSVGSPIKMTSTPEGPSCTYEYETGDESSPGRAILHLLLDVCTIGFWELPGTIIEAYQGNGHTISVKYNQDEKVKDFHAK